MLLLYLFAESVTCHRFLTSWAYIDAVKVNLISLHIKNRIAIQPPLPSILKVYLHDVLMHVVFLISSFGANMSPFCLFATVGALCVLGRISVLSSGELREGQYGSRAGLSPFYVFCKLKSCCQVRQATLRPFCGAKGKSLSLSVAADSQGKKILSWESFQNTSKLFGALISRYGCEALWSYIRCDCATICIKIWLLCIFLYVTFLEVEGRGGEFIFFES
uniref:Uncharacterized protein n=1 Tax=Falco tinnunculus TaxID=100819 RepID=A0A8C4V492_FALTI